MKVPYNAGSQFFVSGTGYEVIFTGSQPVANKNTITLLEVKTNYCRNFVNVPKDGITLTDFCKILNKPLTEEDVLDINHEQVFKRTYKIGNRFKLGSYPEGEYILSCVDHHMFALISIEDGNRWATPVEFKGSMLEIPEDILTKCVQGDSPNVKFKPELIK